MLARSSTARRAPDAPDIVVVGAACLDIKGRLHGASVAHTSNPGVVRLSIGGCARNVAENLARLGATTALISAVCQDDFGRTILHHTARASVNTDYVVVSCDQHSAAYMALLDAHGQLLLGVDDIEATSAITPAIIEAHAAVLTNAQMVMIDANLPISSAVALLDVCRAAGVPVGLDPVAYGPALRYRDYIGQFSLVRPNAVEAQVLTGMPIQTVDQAIHAAKRLVALGVEVAIITLANSGVVYATSDANGHVPAIAVDVVDPTGASDALTATVMYALLNDIPIDEAVRLGVSAAALTLGSTETVCRELSLETLYAQLMI
jgi:pseudouridine kinase